MSQIGKSLPGKYGLNLGHETGIYAWPYAACSGKINENGVYVPLQPKESFNVCMQFCKNSKDVNEVFDQINPNGEGAQTCEAQCRKIADKLGVTVIENYTEKHEDNKPYWVLPIIIAPIIILLLIFFLK